MSETKPEAPKTTKVRIYKPHTHAGKRITPSAEGVEIEVTEHQAKFLERAGITSKPEAAPSEAPAIAAPAKPAGPVVTADAKTIG